MGKGSRMTFRAGSSSPSGSRLQTRVGSLKTRSDVARKTHQPGLFCVMHAKLQKMEKIVNFLYRVGSRQPLV